ncbi:MAG: CocE/NonD family hydrolase [Pirellulaceae bacterium]|jgi:predicted acyl esterase|nr:CocE/NonD family hydrolase [Pirellulaceae bacterium]
MGSYLHLPCPGRRAKGETACQDSTNVDKQPDMGARFGLLISTGGLWKGKRLIGEQWLQGHAGLDIQVVAGDAETKVSITKVNTKGFPFGQKVGAQCNFSFPRELIARSVDVQVGGSMPVHKVKVEKNVRIPMCDGVSLSAEIYRPDVEDKFPAPMMLNYYLHSGGAANTLEGDGRLGTNPPLADAPPDQYTYDPADPVYTLGGQMSTHREIWDPKDRRERQTRRDVLVYSTKPLEADTEVTGPVELKLYAASSAVDTDFTATLTDVHPDGRAIHICEGIRRASFRESLEDPTPIDSGKIYEFTVSLWETSMVFKAGHRIRLEVSSSNFPRHARNLNTGLPLGTSDEMKKATQTASHEAHHASHLVLPIIPHHNGE